MDCLILGETLHKLRIYQIYSTAKERTPSLLVIKPLRVITTENRNQEGGKKAEQKAHLTVLYIYHKNMV